MKCGELMDDSIFDFDNASEEEDCFVNISWMQQIKIQRERLKHLALELPQHYIRPLKNLSLTHKKVLKEQPKTYRLQELAWPHLLEGRSAIIIDPSDNLADLVYLPVICTHVNAIKVNAKRNGPLAIIICRNENRCDDIAKRCISFSPNGFMARSSVCVLYEKKKPPMPVQQFKYCQIFVTTSSYILRCGLHHLRSFDSVQQIVFDGLDTSVTERQFEKIILAMSAVPNQVIITSKFWRTVLTQIQNNANRSNDFVIFGSPLDIAIAADTKFDIMFTKRSDECRLELILEKVKNVVSEKFLIICSDRTDLAEMRKNLKTVHIQSNCIETSWRNDELHKFVYARKIVYFCIHRMLMSPAPPDDLSRVSYYFIYKFGNSADLPAIDNTCIAMFNRILLNKKPDQWYLKPSNRPTVAFFHNFDDKARTMELSKYFISYQSVVHCRRFWSHVSATNLLVAVRKHLRI